MARANWYLPLVAGKETVVRNDLEYPLGQLPTDLLPEPTTPAPGLLLWLDASINSSLHGSADGRIHKWDNLAQHAATAVQAVLDLRPRVDTSSLAPRVVNFKD